MRRGKTLEFDEDDDDDEAEKEERKGEVTLEEIENQRNLESGLEEQTVDGLGPGSTSTEIAMDQVSGKQSSTQEEVISAPGVRSNKNPQSETGPPGEEIDEQLCSSEKKAMSSCNDPSWLIESGAINNASKLVKKRVQLVGKNGLKALKLASRFGGMANVEVEANWQKRWNKQPIAKSIVTKTPLDCLKTKGLVEMKPEGEAEKPLNKIERKLLNNNRRRKGGEKMRSLLDERYNHVDQDRIEAQAKDSGPKEPIQVAPDRHLLQNLEITLDGQKLKLMEIEIERVCKTFNSFPKKLQKALKLKDLELNSKRLRKSLKMTGHNCQLEDKMVKAIGLSNWRVERQQLCS
ncbi:hypothetical protein PPACK8108_LOCUS10245 [Phakopsora pachyrhizi]|uniref:Uncharacterized protein n=1 Tax=Phakopsora pachyrhizi TaxID=170000 RepID=A0AAV0B0V3_PHAPC|nr:hypothetical protein PPACK8108_LOCUS10245 [Phakopsora pachyrhizi]